MPKTTDLLEDAVAVVRANTPDDTRQTPRQRATIDKAFARILTLIAPRIRHFIRQYGLVAHWDDAEQVCAIAVHRAIVGYDPAKAKFTTFVNWQIRGELQGLRFRLMADQRTSAKKVSAITVSLDALAIGIDGEEGAREVLIEDEGALASTEAAASSFMAGGVAQALLGGYVDHLRTLGIKHLLRTQARPDAIDTADLDARLKRDREIVALHLFGTDEVATELPDDLTRERLRQLTRRASRIMSDLAEDGAYLRTRAPLPIAAQHQDQMRRVQAIVPASIAA